MKNKISKAFFIGAAFYTVTTAILLFISIIIDLDKALDPHRFLLILLFSFIASSTHVIAEIRALPSGLSHLIAGAGFIGAAFFCVILPSGSEFTATVIFTAVVSLAYVIVRVIATSRKNHTAASSESVTKPSASNDKKTTVKKSKKMREEEEYQSIFSSGTDKK